MEAAITAVIVDNGRLKQELEIGTLASRDQNKALLLHLLEVVDAFERVVNAAEGKEETSDREFNRIMINFKSVLKMLQNILNEEGVRLIEFSDGRANISDCKIVRAEKKEGYTDLTILQILEMGYYWKGEILRKASVIVSKK